MERSLSVVLPVHNAQYDLVGQVRRLLELLPEISRQFEIVIVDDGSTDQTDEVAYELDVQYAQVRLVRHNQRMGESAAAQTGVRNATGDIIFVQAENETICEQDLRRVISSTQAPIDVENIEPKPLDAGLIQRLVNWGTELKRAQTSPEKAREFAGPKYAKNSDDAGLTIPTRRKRAATERTDG
jgi:glycosyltransferase involved in cell wall biosynthesis